MQLKYLAQVWQFFFAVVATSITLSCGITGSRSLVKHGFVATEIVALSSFVEQCGAHAYGRFVIAINTVMQLVLLLSKHARYSPLLSWLSCIPVAVVCNAQLCSTLNSFASIFCFSDKAVLSGDACKSLSY